MKIFDGFDPFNANQKQTCNVLDIAHTTLNAWCESKGCPRHETSPRVYAYNISKIIEWRIERAKASEAISGSEAISKESVDLRLKQAKAEMEELKLAEKKEMIMARTDHEEIVLALAAKVKEVFSDVTFELCDDMLHVKDQEEAKARILEELEKKLFELSSFKYE